MADFGLSRTQKLKKLDAAQVTAWALQHGWKLERNKLTARSKSGSILRLLCNDRSVRMEVRVDHADGTKSWTRVQSGYYKNLRIEDGRLIGMTREGC